LFWTLTSSADTRRELRQQTGAVVSVRVEPASVAANLGHEARVKEHE